MNAETFNPFPRELSLARQIFAAVLMLICLSGCSKSGNSAGSVDIVWGKRGLLPGDFTKPRAIVIDEKDNLYLVDMRAMIQVFDVDGKFLRAWQTPHHENGRPSGLCFDQDGSLLVADSHYHQILVYDRNGSLIKIVAGDKGNGPLVGYFGYIADVAVDSKGNWYVADDNGKGRITKLDRDMKILKHWGGRGPEPGEFQRIRSMVFDKHDNLYVADACNHRIQVFDVEGKLLRIIGEQGAGPGQLNYPYDVVVAPDDSIYVLEYGNHRVQHFTSDGKPLGTWGTPGKEKGQLWNPWAVGVDSKGRLHVVDSSNHRVQRVIF